MNTVFLMICLAVSVTVFIAAVVVAVNAYVHRGKGKSLFSGLNYLTFGVYISCAVIYLPMYYKSGFFKDPLSYVRPILLSLFSSFQVFFLGADYDDIIRESAGLGDAYHMAFGFCVAVLFVIAPILTLGNILSLFKNLKNEIRLKLAKKKTLYVFSELNERSIATARSIVEGYDEIKKVNGKNSKPLIVFTDVFTKSEEDDYELIQQSLEIKAICLKKDITRLNFKNKKNRIEYFLIGDNESENIDQVIKLNDENKDINNRAVFLYSSRPGAGYVIDSIDKGERNLSKNTKNEIAKYTKEFLEGEKQTYDTYDINSSYLIRRIDCVHNMTVNFLRKKEVLKLLFENRTPESDISILIVGLGSYGFSFLKNILWMYQFSGIKLTINIIEAIDATTIKKRIKSELPDIADRLDSHETEYIKCFCEEDGFVNFDIRIYSSVDCCSADINELFDKETVYTSFEKICFSLVTLGDDEKNIEAAVALRRMFDRFFMRKGSEKSPMAEPVIYSVVYDDKKANSLNLGKEGMGIINHKKQPYNIRFIGNMSEQFSYRTILDLKTDETEAITYHFDWVKNAYCLRKHYNRAKKTAEDNEDIKLLNKEIDIYLDQLKKSGKKEEIYWGDESYYSTLEEFIDNTKEKPKTENVLYFDSENKERLLDTSKVLNEIEKYADFEYFRNSSVAKSIQKKIIKENLSEYFEAFNTENKKEHSEICSCGKCIALRKTEHMRWDAYMMSNGYIYGEKRFDRALYHNSMTNWHDLPFQDKYKD